VLKRAKDRKKNSLSFDFSKPADFQADFKNGEG
jgi:hypothetical protein